MIELLAVAMFLMILAAVLKIIKGEENDEC